MQFPLADRDGASGSRSVSGFERFDVRFEFLQVVDSIVGDAERADLAGLLGGEECVPGFQARGLTAVGGVDQV